MNTLPYPGGAARAIAQARASGLKPAEIVLIDLAGKSDWPNPTVYADPSKRYCWDWIKGLSVVVLINASTRLGTILSDIEDAEPAQTDVIDTERRLGWLINATRPKLKTVRHPAAWLDDWLGPCTWHRDLKHAKEAALQLAAERAQQHQEILELEPVWN